MDDLAVQFLLLNGDEADLFDDDDGTQVLAAALIAGIKISQQESIDTRNPHRLYLCRPQLLPNPRVDTPWQVLYRSQNDRAFITTMGIDVDTFASLLTSGFAQRWYEMPVPRNDVNQGGDPRIERRSLDAAGALGLVLHYLSSTMHAISLQQIFAIIPSTVTRYLHFGLNLLLLSLRTIRDATIWWLEGPEFARCSALVVARHSRLAGAFGSIDGLKPPVQTSDDVDIENATFNGWLSEHFISSVLVFSAEGVVIAARMNAPDHTPPTYYIVADTAFPRGTNDIHRRICAPLKQGQRLQGSVAEIDECMAFNRELLSYRQTAEWGMRGLQGAFGRLRVPLEIANKEARGDLIEICVRLHNLHAIRVGINQIRTVYLKCWQDTDDDTAVWQDFENMLFSEQREKDRVSRFHVTLQYLE
ncbi:hypothetical protein CY34DRAFT_19081 [Suillus luteus UH-Slu-Lm8-n1]|uniref:DDE Tnp4 domain-containing protein n=1 Tax=Suillus luteus UH-Slu-Lm8-n1 TaxID=930992 RepID=A0A0C9ZSY6_9AGAM|nr:hypothetical protein CY34DRAFT_19081 [Suillus luteus UH-Slu-Lm8-n1]